VIESQIVGPLDVPGGKVVNAPFEITRRLGRDEYQVMPITYGDPSSEDWTEVWEKQGAAALAQVLPPTEEP
jgi:hypothetical protein